MPCTSTIAGVEDVAVGVVYRLPYRVRGRPRGSVTGKQTVSTCSRGSILIFGSAAPAAPTRQSDTAATASAVRARRTALRIAGLWLPGHACARTERPIAEPITMWRPRRLTQARGRDGASARQLRDGVWRPARRRPAAPGLVRSGSWPD